MVLFIFYLYAVLVVLPRREEEGAVHQRGPGQIKISINGNTPNFYKHKLVFSAPVVDGHDLPAYDAGSPVHLVGRVR